MSNQHLALLVSSPGGTFNLGLRPTPTPGPNQLLIRNKAVSLNPADWIMHKTGFILSDHGWPIILGQDGAGEIVSLGSNVKGWGIGDKVFYQSYFTQDRCTFQEYVIADADRVARIPDGMSFEGAASIPLAIAAAAIGMYEGKKGELRKDGQDVGGAGLVAPWKGGRGKYVGQAAVVMSGSSSVGQYAIQFAKLSGFNPIITTASKHNEAYCKAAGATHVIDYNEVPYEQLSDTVAGIIGDIPLTLVYNAVSNPASQKAGWEMLGQDGTMVIVNPPSEVVADKRGKEDEKGRRVVWVFGVATDPDHEEFGVGMYAALTEMFEKRELKPNKVENIGHGLEAIPAGLVKLQKGRTGITLPNSVEEIPGRVKQATGEKAVSGVKLVVTL